MKQFFFSLVALLCLVSCSKSMKKQISIDNMGPNEHLVKKYQKLKIPQEFSLPPPQDKDKAQ